VVGEQLGAVLQHLCGGGGGPATAAAVGRVVLMGHSLGGRVVLHALASIKPPPQQHAPGLPPHRHLVHCAALLGAANTGPEEHGKDGVWRAALGNTGERLVNVYNSHDPALLSMATLGRVLTGVDVLVRHRPVGLREVALPSSCTTGRHGGAIEVRQGSVLEREHRRLAAKLLNVDATHLFSGLALKHSYQSVIKHLLSEELAPLFDSR